MVVIMVVYQHGLTSLGDEYLYHQMFYVVVLKLGVRFATNLGILPAKPINLPTDGERLGRGDDLRHQQAYYPARDGVHETERCA